MSVFFSVDSVSPRQADGVDKLMYEDQSLLEHQEHWKHEYPIEESRESPNYHNDRSNDVPSPYNTSDGGLNSSYLSDENNQSYNPDSILPNKEGVYFCHLCSFNGKF